MTQKIISIILLCIGGIILASGCSKSDEKKVCNNTLFEAAVSEGLADHFSIEVAGIIPPLWIVALTSKDVQHWIEAASNIWNEPSYNHYLLSSFVVIKAVKYNGNFYRPSLE